MYSKQWKTDQGKFNAVADPQTSDSLVVCCRVRYLRWIITGKEASRTLHVPCVNTDTDAQQCTGQPYQICSQHRSELIEIIHIQIVVDDLHGMIARSLENLCQCRSGSLLQLGCTLFPADPCHGGMRIGLTAAAEGRISEFSYNILFGNTDDAGNGFRDGRGEIEKIFPGDIPENDLRHGCLLSQAVTDLSYYHYYTLQAWYNTEGAEKEAGAMCALSEDSLLWEIMNNYSIDPATMDFNDTVMKIAGEHLVSPADVAALLKQFYGEEGWKA